MNVKYWQVIRDDAKKTFEVCAAERNTNHFANTIQGMQRLGMNVTGMTPPVTNKFSHKDAFSIPGYRYEEGLEKRLMAEYLERTRRSFEE